MKYEMMGEFERDPYITELLNEADALFERCEALDAEARTETDGKRRRALLTEAGELHRLAWEMKRRAER